MRVRAPVGLACLAFACGRAPAAAPASSASQSVEAKGTSELTPMATCPEDSTWSAGVCQGHGYVACPAGMHLDPQNQCAPARTSKQAGSEGRDAGVPAED
jgi:hypothetical protein